MSQSVERREAGYVGCAAKSLRPRLLVSAGLAALILAAPVAGQGAAAASLTNFGGSPLTHLSPSSTHIAVPVGNPGVTAVGINHIVGRGTTNPGNGDPCRRERDRRCVVNNPPGDHPGNGDGHPRDPHHPIGLPILPVVPVPANPVIVSTPPSGTGTPPANPGTPANRNGGAVAQNDRLYVPDEVVVELSTATTTRQADALLRRYRLTRMQSVDLELTGTRLFRWHIGDRRSVPAVVQELRTAGLTAQPNYYFVMQDDASTAPHEGDPAQYILDKMHLPQAHELARGDRVLVGVIDSGVDVNHPDLAGDIAGSFDALGGGIKAHAHGTAIAGAIAAHGRLMGAAPAAQILAVRAFSGDGADEGTSFAIMSGLSWAVSHGARVINMSFAGPIDPGISRSLAAAHDKGVVLVAAAGNKGAKSPPLYPAADPYVIAVTATDANDQLPAFANRGHYVAVAAPGVDLMLLGPGGTLQFASGTSFSAAYVSGTAALMLERKPDLAPDTLRQALTGTAHHLGVGQSDNQSGAGLVDAYQAVRSVGPSSVDAANATPAVIPAAISR
jgi:subtilisin family serine protease